MFKKLHNCAFLVKIRHLFLRLCMVMNQFLNMETGWRSEINNWVHMNSCPPKSLNSPFMLMFVKSRLTFWISWKSLFSVRTAGLNAGFFKFGKSAIVGRMFTINESPVIIVIFSSLTFWHTLLYRFMSRYCDGLRRTNHGC